MSAVRDRRTITVDARDLRLALARVKPAVARKGGALPILTSVRLHAIGGNRLTITATDLELAITATIDMKGSKGKPFVLPFTLTNDMVATANKSTGPLTISPTSDGFALEVGRRRCTVTPLPVCDYPRLPDELPHGGDILRVEPLADVARFVSTDAARPILTGVHLGPTTVAGTDSYRLAARYDIDLPSAPEAGFIVPGYAINEAAKIGADAVVRWNDHCIRFDWPDLGTTITALLITGTFPNWAGLIPSADPLMTVRFHDVADVLSALAVLGKSAEVGAPVRISQDGRSNKAVLLVKQEDVGSDEFRVAASFKGKRGVDAFNPAYLADVLSGLDGPDATLATHGPGKPAVVREGARLRLLMPVRTS